LLDIFWAIDQMDDLRAQKDKTEAAVKEYQVWRESSKLLFQPLAFLGLAGLTWKRRSLGSGVCSSPQVPPKKGLDSFLITPHRTPYSRILYQTLVLSSKSILTLPNTLTTILVCGAVFKA